MAAAAIRKAQLLFRSSSDRAMESALSMRAGRKGWQKAFKLGAHSRRFSSTVANDVVHQKFPLDEDRFVDEIEGIRHEYEEGKTGFLNIPIALKEMPKMDPEGIYVNQNVRLDDIQVYGFDYDYTLAHYSGNLQRLIYDLAKKHLVNELRYPESCLQFEYDPKFPIRGLCYDKLR